MNHKNTMIYHCCYMDDNGQHCKQKARFMVSADPWTYDDHTHACGDHVENMKELYGDKVDKLT